MPGRVRAHYRGAGAQSRAVYSAANKPVNSVLPAITGTLTVGSTLTCSNGTWSLSPTLAFQWLRSGSPISGQTAATHLLVAGDSGNTISCSVIATKNGSQTVATSLPTGVVP